MKRVGILLCLAACFVLMAHSAFAQGLPTGSLGGTVLDPDGKAVVGASVTVTDVNTHASFPAVNTGAAGDFRVGNLPPGAYTVTIAMANFKTAVYNNVVIVVDHTYELNAKLEVGAATVSVQVETGGQQVIETQSASVSNTVSGRSVQELPFSSRSAVLLGILDPGVQTSGGPRNSTFEGLPKGTINITFDGINMQCNLLKSSDGYFAINDPRIDDVDEFGITTNANDPSKTGEGAAQMSYVSKRGGNAFHGGVWEYNRNTDYDANYYFNGISHTPRQILDLNDFGYKIGGPILKDKLFFFTDFDFFQFPQSVTRTKTILTPLAASGVFTYAPASGTVIPAGGSGGNTWTTCYTSSAETTAIAAGGSTTSSSVCTANLLQLAGAGGIGGAGATGPSTISTLTGPLIHDVTTALTAPGVGSTVNDLYQDNISFNDKTIGARRYPDVRIDYNITKHHSLEFDYHYAWYVSNPDLLNSVDNTYPVAPFNTAQGEQLSNRNLFSLAERWTIGSDKSNEIRAGLSTDPVDFGLGLPVAQSKGYYPVVPVNVNGGAPANELYTFGISGDSGLFLSPGGLQGRNTATGQLHDTFTWTKGTHTMTYGVDFTGIYYNDFFTVSGSAGFGLATGDPLLSQGTATFGQNNNLPGISSSDLSNAEGLYASLAGRVSSYSSAVAYSPTTGGYLSGAPEVDKDGQHEIGIYGGDSWRLRPNLTFNYGLRWEYDGPPFDKYNEYAMLGGTQAQLGDIWGVSGQGNLFKPGAMGGSSAINFQNDKGQSWYNKYYRALAPSVGLAYQPNWDSGWAKKLFGEQGKTVIRAGYSIAYSREGLEAFFGVAQDNPGEEGSQASTPSLNGNSTTLGTFTPGSINLGNGSTSLPYLSQTPTSFQSSFAANPAVSSASEGFAINPNLKPPMIQSWSAGIQRELTPNMVLEVRYQANHGDGEWDLFNINEVNIFENGFLTEFNNAANNLSLCNANLATVSSVAQACLSAEQDLGIVKSTATKGTADFANLYAAANAAITGGTCAAGSPCSASALAAIAGDASLPIFTASFDPLSTPTAVGATSNSVATAPITATQLAALETSGSYAALNPSSPSVLTGIGQTNANFTSSTFLTPLGIGGAGSAAGSLGSGSSAYNNFVTHLLGAGYPMNFWIVNPTLSGGAFALANAVQSTYNAGVIDLRRRPSHGLQFDANYVYSKSLTDYNANSSLDNASFPTLRSTKYDKGPAAFDIPQAFKLQAIYDLPFGQGKKWASSSGFVNRIIGGWSVDTITRWQTGPPILISSGVSGGNTFNSGIGGVNLQGITVQQLQSMLTTNKLEGGSNPFVYYVPTNLLDSNLQKANTSIIQPCNVAGALCGRPFVYGPQYFRTDLSVVKVTKITERVNFEMRAELLNAWNDADFYFGCGVGTSPCTLSTQSNNFGKMGNGSASTAAYTDLNTTYDPGGRLIQLVGRINF